MMSAMVHVQGAAACRIDARALLDTCSTNNFVTLEFVRRLRLSIQPNKMSVGAVNGMETETKGTVEIVIRSRTSNYREILPCLVVSKIIDFTPSVMFPREKIHISENIHLADPQFHIPRSVDLLINAGTSVALLSVGQIRLSHENYELRLQKTLLGWVITGGMDDDTEAPIACHLSDLSKQITSFWEIEECTGGSTRSREDEQSEAHYVKTVRRDSSGRYTVRLPFKEDNVGFGNSRAQAVRRLYSLQRRLHAEVELQREYSAVIQDYLSQGHMSHLEEEPTGGYYMPHHAVLKPTSTTTKVRVVFDASAKSDTGHSLNRALRTGPTIQPKLFEHLLRFRAYKYVLTADIEQMYRQVSVDPRDRQFQRIVWQREGEIETFQLNTVTFGVSAAPYLAIRTLHQLATDERARFPRASDSLTREFYVDDWITGADSLEEILARRDEMIGLLRSGGFNIRKWGSNHNHVLDDLEQKDFSSTDPAETDSARKTLGITWQSRLDELAYSVKSINCADKVTKRVILSEIAKVFDPLGLLGPVVLALKSIIQDCWKLKIGWDESVPQTIHTTWRSFVTQLPLIRELAIPRHLVLPNYKDVQIHGFCDASKRGYGACLYLRSVNAESRVLVRLACAKSRVAPVSQLSIPRLELCGAVLLTRLFAEARVALTYDTRQIFFWTDSEIVLSWLGKSPSDLQVFEGNRIAEIQRASAVAQWRHVRSKDNPADPLSRGQTPAEFVRNRAWFDGLPWLYRAEDQWPVTEKVKLTELPGVRKPACLVTALDDPFYARISSYSKLVGIVAFCLRVSMVTKPKTRVLDRAERDEAERRLWKFVQNERYADEINRISGGAVAKSAKLAALDPYLDEFGVLRVGGRLRNARIPESQKHPVLLPSRHHVTDLIIRETHDRLFHAGVRTTLYTVRHRFWLVDGTTQVKRIIHRCVECLRRRPTPMNSKMSDLPPSRVQQCPVFSHVGVDFFGPVLLKEREHKNRVIIKGYGCIFVCMATKAVHIEIVSDLSTERFLAAFRRFIARRGIPSHVYSDNGSNFVGANNQLRELFVLCNAEPFQNAVSDCASRLNIKWHFNPPLSPHFGGIWEAAVKSFKHHFYRVVGETSLTFEAFTTLAAEIEAILNSRPIGLMSSDPNDPAILTPAHFLIGRPLVMLPQPDYALVPRNRLSIWRFISKTVQDFWKSWHLDYLSEVQRWQKWTKGRGELSNGSVVIVIEREHQCNRWPLGVVLETYPGSDGNIRVAKIRTSQGEYIRNVTRLCPIPHVTESEADK